MKFNFTKTPYDQAIQRVIEGISITRTGRIGLTKFFIMTHNIQKGMRAYMYWDAGNKAIAILFTRSNDEAAYPVGFTRQYGAFVNASKFFKLHRLSIEEYAARYAYEVMSSADVGIEDGAKKVFVIELDKPMKEEKHGGK